MTRAYKIYISAFIVLASFITGIVILIGSLLLPELVDNKIGFILMLPMTILAIIAVIKGKTRRCIECGKKLQRHSAFIDYCLDCGRKKELMKSRSS